MKIPKNIFQEILLVSKLVNHCIIAKTICTNFQNEMCKNRHFFVVCLPVLEYHLKGF